jgi:hypothetical protein
MFIDVECVVCHKVFSRRKAEHTRNQKLGRRVYCSRKCCGKDNINNLPVEKVKEQMELFIGRKNPANRKDDLSPFRYHIQRIKQHEKNRGYGLSRMEIDLKDLKDQWENQKGKCPYTGWDLITVENTNYGSRPPLTPCRASVDRIDSSKGYTKDNIQFIAFIAQMAKHQFCEADLYHFCKAVVSNYELAT